jgi:hypothetical protein
MAPHLTTAEQDKLLEWNKKGFTPIQTHAKLEAARERKGIEPHNLTSVRKFLKGKTHRRARIETRGRGRTYTLANVRAMNKARKDLVKKTKGGKYISWDHIKKAARVPDADRTTVAKAFQEAGLAAAFRNNREKPQRTKEHKAIRKKICDKMRKFKKNYFRKDCLEFCVIS